MEAMEARASPYEIGRERHSQYESEEEWKVRAELEINEEAMAKSLISLQ